MKSSTLQYREALRRRPLVACLAAALVLTQPAVAGHRESFRPLGNGSAAAAGMRVAELFAKRAPRVAVPDHPPALATTAQPGSTVTVTSCADDGGNGTLRQLALNANSGDIIDLSGLACSTITLQSGQIIVTVADLTLQGPGAGRLTIDGNQSDRVILHAGQGTLHVNDLTLAHGSVLAVKAYAGCVYSKGNITLTRSTVTSCVALGQQRAIGGGLIAYDKLILDSSTVTGNVADAPSAPTGTISGAAGGAFAHEMVLQHSTVSGNTAHGVAGKAYGGGVVGYAVTSKYSSISGNQAISHGDASNYSIAGGIAAAGTLFMQGSTIDHNKADVAGGVLIADSGSGFATIVQSTISSNHGDLSVGGIAAETGLTMSNSTIAFNTGGASASGGLAALGTTAGLQSSIIADNTPIDLDGFAVFAGAGNLIRSVGANVTVPVDTIALDPVLGPLVDNGGATRTHAPAAGSPVIDAGNNASNLGSDQRGIGYARVVGMSADIGALEADPDRIFGSGLDVP